MAVLSESTGARLAYIGIGSNLGDRLACCNNAISIIDSDEGCQVTACSRWFETEPVGMESENWFLNGVAAVHTTRAPEEFMQLLLVIEKRLGRQRGQVVSDRTVDLDLLYYQDVFLGWDGHGTDDSGRPVSVPEKGAGLIVPHPAIGERRFVLEPWAEIAPDLFLRPWNATVYELLMKMGKGGAEVRPCRAL